MTDVDLLCGYCVDLPEVPPSRATRITHCPLCHCELAVNPAGQTCRLGAEGPPPAHPIARRALVIGLLVVLAAGVAAALWMALRDNGPTERPVVPPPPEPVVESEPRAEPPPARVKRFAAAWATDAATAKPLPAMAGPNPARAGVRVEGEAAKAPAELPDGGPKDAAKLPPPPPIKIALPDLGHAEAYSQLVTRAQFLMVPELALEAANQQSAKHDAKAIAALAKEIRAKNAAEPDGFIRHLSKERSDLAGLPFLLGKSCQIDKSTALQLRDTSRGVRRNLELMSNPLRHSELAGKQHGWTVQPPASADHPFWQKVASGPLTARPDRADAPDLMLWLPALTQILPTENEGYRLGLVDVLQRTSGTQAARALARLAIFDPDVQVRRHAQLALHSERRSDALPVLLDGLRHPWLPVARRSAEALVDLGNEKTVPQLIAALDAPDPAEPAEKVIDGKKVLMQPELVRVNHHRNCLLCHAPTAAKLERTDLRDMIVAQVPSPSEKLPPSSSVVYYDAGPGMTLVRADITYLRQDFSVMLPVENPAPWPTLQRFDFLVRTRALAPAEVERFREQKASRGPEHVSPHRQAVLSALRRLTGQDHGTTAAAWREGLKQH